MNNANRLPVNTVQGLFQHFTPGTFASPVFRPPPQYQAQQATRTHPISPIPSSSPILNQRSPTLLTNPNNSLTHRRTVDDDGQSSSGFSSHSSLSCNSNIHNITDVHNGILNNEIRNLITLPTLSSTTIGSLPITSPVTSPSSSKTFLNHVNTPTEQSKLDPLVCRSECPLIFYRIIVLVNNKLSIFEEVINIIETPMDIYNEEIDGFEKGEKIDNEDEIIANLRKLNSNHLKFSDITNIYDRIILPYIKIQKKHIGEAEEMALWLGYKTKIKRLVKLILPFVHQDIHLTVLLLSVLFKQTFNVKYLKFIGDYLKYCYDINHGETRLYLIELYKNVKTNLLYHFFNYIDTHVKCRQDNLFLAYPKFISKYIDVLVSFGYLSNCIDMIFDFFSVCCSFDYALCINKTFDHITKMLQVCEREELPHDVTAHYIKLLVTSLSLFTQNHRAGSFVFEYVSALMKFRKACQRKSDNLYQLVYKETDPTLT